jgi:ABC-type sugar transport system substrate-binding protein
VPQASPAALQAAIQHGFLSNRITYSSLNPVLQRTINKAATPLTAAQWSKLQECLRATSCETGHGTLTVGLANDGINPWRQTWRAEFTAAAIQSPEVAKIIYNLGVSVPQWIANVNSLIAQKVDIIAMNSVYGAAVLPAVQAAKSAGVIIVQVGTPMPAEVKAQLSGEADDNLCAPWQLTAQDLVKQFPSGGTYGLYTGIPGNGSAAAWQPCLTGVLNAHGWHQVIQGFTQWTEQGNVQQGSALFASGKNPTFAAYDYTLVDFAKPYINAGKTPPILATDAENQAFLTLVKQAQAKGVKVQAYISTARDWYSRIGLEYGLMLKEGIKVTPFTMPSGAETLDQLLAGYNPAMPANAPVPTFFNAAQESWILSAQS